MVKKIISNILKGKDEKAEGADSKDAKEDVPDELPSLGEEVVEGPKADKKEEEPGSDLKGLELDDSADDKPVETSTDEKKEEEVKKEEPKKEKPEPAKEIAEEPPVEEVDNTFFSTLMKSLDAGKMEVHEKILSEDLLARMKKHWDIRKGAAKEVLSSNKTKLQFQLKRELQDLKRLEERWHTQKTLLEDDLKILRQREEDIKDKIIKVRSIVDYLKLFHDVKPDQYFVFDNGIVVKNLRQLIDALEIVDNDTFKLHVGKPHNDIAKWVGDVIGEVGLASKLNHVRTRDDMIKILEDRIEGKFNVHDFPIKH